MRSAPLAAAAVVAAGMLVGAGSASAGPGSGCLAHHPQYIEGVIEVDYAAGCSGHDEPELDPRRRRLRRHR
jgi:hypothetical protein